MSSLDFAKMACPHCGGHIEFPASVLGQSASCPHCGKLVMLKASIPAPKFNRTRYVWLSIAVAVGLYAIGFVVFLVLHKKTGIGGSAPAPATVQSNTPKVSVTAPIAAPEPQPEAETNDFAIMPYKLEKTPGSSLVYVIGTLRNLANQQRFGVKIEFSLFDANDNPVGSATDYQAVLDPHGTWRFKALVMESRTASAKFSSIVEDK